MANIALNTPESRGRFPRLLLRRVLQDLEVYPAVAVMGARQVGKSTLARVIAGRRGLAYRTLDDRDVRTQALEDPEGEATADVAVRVAISSPRHACHDAELDQKDQRGSGKDGPPVAGEAHENPARL